MITSFFVYALYVFINFAINIFEPLSHFVLEFFQPVLDLYAFFTSGLCIKQDRMDHYFLEVDNTLASRLDWFRDIVPLLDLDQISDFF